MKNHQGIARAKALAYSYVWRPGNDKEIETSVKTCNHHTSPEKRSNTPMGKYHITRGKNSY